MGIRHHAENALAIWIIGMLITAVVVPLLAIGLPAGLGGITHFLDIMTGAAR